MRIILGLSLSLQASTAFAQSAFITPSGAYVEGRVLMCDSAGVKVPCTLSNPVPVLLAGPYPSGGVPLVVTASGTTGAVVATIPSTGGKTTYICGFNTSSAGAGVPVAGITLNNLSGSVTFTYQNVIPGAIPFTQTFNPCMPASAIATPITIVSTPNALATAVTVNAWGFQL